MYERCGTLIENKFREYLIPTILMTVAISVANVVNSIIVGNLLGETALSAIGLSAPVIFCLNSVFLLFAIGGVTCVSIAKGRRETEQANRIFTVTFAAGISAMFVLPAALLLFMQPVTSVLTQGDGDLAALTRAYLTPAVFVGPVMMLIMGMAYFVRTDGKPRIAAYIAITANAANLVLTFAFVKFLNLGLTGAGLAITLGYTTGILVLLPYFRSKQRTLRFVKPQISDIAHIPRIMGTGSPKALTQGLLFLRALVLNMLIMGSLGSPGMAAMTICFNALMLTAMFISGANDTLLPIAGTLYGEKDYPGIRFTARAAFKFMIIASAVMMALFLILPGEVGRLFGINSPEGLALVEPALRMYALCLPLYGVNTMLQCIFQTTGRVKLAALIVFMNGFGFVLLFAMMFAAWNMDFFWLSFLLAEAAAFLVILSIGARIRKKESVDGVLLLHKEHGDEKLLDLSIPATVEAAAGLSEQVINFCKKNGADGFGAARIGIAAEEMAVNIANYGRRKNTAAVIDVLIRVTEQELILRLRDSGVPFNPTEYREEEKKEFAVGGIEVVRRLTKDISYAWQLGFNVSVITISRTVLLETEKNIGK
ncbi:MAG: ATP-binding protein [Chitinispirillales bacterium]|jgi:putative MATE family efflux protein|nr:ATP-binding protein [Chitinispirillales bacterium]